MSQPFIVLGDKTDHGGTVIGADFTCDINGKYLARVGDLTVCPRKGCRGTFPIVSGASDMVSMSQAPARHGDKTACGATLLSSQATTIWSSAGGVSADSAMASSDAARLPTGVLPASPTLCIECLAKAAASGAGFVARG